MIRNKRSNRWTTWSVLEIAGCITIVYGLYQWNIHEWLCVPLTMLCTLCTAGTLLLAETISIELCSSQLLLRTVLFTIRSDVTNVFCFSSGECQAQDDAILGGLSSLREVYHVALHYGLPLEVFQLYCVTVLVQRLLVLLAWKVKRNLDFFLVSWNKEFVKIFFSSLLFDYGKLRNNLVTFRILQSLTLYTLNI